MDKASLIGVIIGLMAIGWVGYRASGGHWEMFYSEKGLVAVFGGCISVCFMAMPMDRIKQVGGFLRRFMFHKARPAGETVKLVSELAEHARRDGILSLESRMADIEKNDAFLAAGLRMTIDGMDPDSIEGIMRMEIMAMQDRHKSGKKFFDLLKVYGPGWGLVATLIGQIGMFAHLGGAIEEMGHMLAVAVVATMYACVIANGIAGPIGDKLALRSSEEILSREMVLQGILSIQAGDNPRLTMDKLYAFIPSAARTTMKQAA